jgi:hypothetical protein
MNHRGDEWKSNHVTPSSFAAAGGAMALGYFALLPTVSRWPNSGLREDWLIRVLGESRQR